MHGVTERRAGRRTKFSAKRGRTNIDIWREHRLAEHNHPFGRHNRWFMYILIQHKRYLHEFSGVQTQKSLTHPAGFHKDESFYQSFRIRGTPYQIFMNPI